MVLTAEAISERAGTVAGDFGQSLVAGFAGTAVLTAAQIAEMKLSKREGSTIPVETAGKVLGFSPRKEEDKSRLNLMVHYTYGSLWGLARGLLKSFGLKSWQADLLHFAAVWGTELVMLPSLKITPPPQKWSFKSLITDAAFHAVYAAAVGFIFDKLYDSSCSHKL
ncbi:MAG TPA: hypothetical protein VIK89_16605 [Cytophagaceae bacterium]